MQTSCCARRREYNEILFFSSSSSSWCCWCFFFSLLFFKKPNERESEKKRIFLLSLILGQMFTLLIYDFEPKPFSLCYQSVISLELFIICFLFYVHSMASNRACTFTLTFNRMWEKESKKKNLKKCTHIFKVKICLKSIKTLPSVVRFIFLFYFFFFQFFHHFVLHSVWFNSIDLVAFSLRVYLYWCWPIGLVRSIRNPPVRTHDWLYVLWILWIK